MFQSFFPDTCEKSVYDIKFDKYFKAGYRGVIFDIDNTLVEHGKDATPRAIALLARLKKKGWEIFLLSNNNEERVKRFNREIQTNYIYKANKPSVKNYVKACELMGTTNETTLFVGDQLFTDVYGAKRSKLYTILVEPIDKNEEIQIVMKRYLEKVVLYFYKRDKNAPK